MFVDEAPLTCEVFVEEGGMQCFMRVLEVYVLRLMITFIPVYENFFILCSYSF